jgi:hypothetical protein
MTTKSLPAPVLTMCFVQIISTALITYIFPFVASCKSMPMNRLTRSLAIDECRRARGPDLRRLGRQHGSNRRCCRTSHCKSNELLGPGVADISQHVQLIRHFPHRHLFAFTPLLSGATAGLMGFCTLPWQLVALRGLMGLVHFGGFISVISLGELVDEESRNEGMPAVLTYGRSVSSYHSLLLASCRKRNWGNVRLGHRRVSVRAAWASSITV